MAARAAVDGEGFGEVAPRREVPIATGNRGRSGRDVLAGCPSVIEQDKQDGLSPHVNRRLSQSLSHAGWTLLVEPRPIGGHDTAPEWDSSSTVDTCARNAVPSIDQLWRHPEPGKGPGTVPGPDWSGWSSGGGGIPGAPTPIYYGHNLYLATSESPVLRGVVEKLDRLDPPITEVKELGKSHRPLGEVCVVHHGGLIA